MYVYVYVYVWCIGICLDFKLSPPPSILYIYITHCLFPFLCLHSFVYLFVCLFVYLILNKGEDEFLIVASDGFWDVFSNDNAIYLTREMLQNKELTLSDIAQALTAKAFAR